MVTRKSISNVRYARELKPGDVFSLPSENHEHTYLVTSGPGAFEFSLRSVVRLTDGSMHLVGNEYPVRVVSGVFQEE